jgi:hypothetical protein
MTNNSIKVSAGEGPQVGCKTNTSQPRTFSKIAQWVISLNLVLAGLRLGLKNRQVGEKWVSDDCSYLCKGLSE